jgi:O-succinylbenzoic acid--CoA ligase
MEIAFNKVHPRFKFQGIHYSFDQLFEIGYSLIKEGEPFERAMGDFMMDWYSPHDTIPAQTSGSTGRPKVVHLHKQAMVNSALATGAYFDLQEGDRALLCLSAEHIASKMMLVRAMVLGLELDYVLPSKSPLEGSTNRYEFCAMAPLQLQNSVDKLQRIKTLIVGGATVSQELQEKVRNCKTRIFETYGMTETCSHIAVRQINASSPKGESNIKQASFETLAGITVSKDDRDCLVIHAPMLASDPFVTNDIVELLSETSFNWIGRFDNVINSGGIKLFPEQIEGKMAGAVKSRFFVAGIPDNELGQKLVLVVEGEGHGEKILDTLKSLSTLEKFEFPKEIISIARFKLTSNGKILRKATLDSI